MVEIMIFFSRFRGNFKIRSYLCFYLSIFVLKKIKYNLDVVYIFTFKEKKLKVKENNRRKKTKLSKNYKQK